MKKMGRPTEALKDNYVGIRLSSEELEMLEKCKIHTGMTKTGVIRAGIQLVWEQVKNNVFRDKG